MSTLLLAVLICAIVIFIGLELMSKIGMNMMVNRKVKTEDELLSRMESKGFYKREEYESIEYEAITLKSEDGYNLEGRFINGDKKKCVVIVHGITVGMPISYRYAKSFMDKGWSVLMFSQRRHGNSEGDYTTLGYYEKIDLSSWMEWLKIKVDDDAIIGLHGESMGASTVLQYDKEVDFIVADCGFSDLEQLIEHRFKEDFKIPFKSVLRYYYRKIEKKAGFKVQDVKPINILKESSTPTLFIHGEEDKFVPTFMSNDMYEHKKGYKEIYIAKGAKHAQAIEVDKEKYEKVMFDFIETSLIKRETP